LISSILLRQNGDRQRLQLITEPVKPQDNLLAAELAGVSAGKIRGLQQCGVQAVGHCGSVDWSCSATFNASLRDDNLEL
jgi:hypothetical protein